MSTMAKRLVRVKSVAKKTVKVCEGRLREEWDEKEESVERERVELLPGQRRIRV